MFLKLNSLVVTISLITVYVTAYKKLDSEASRAIFGNKAEYDTKYDKFDYANVGSRAVSDEYDDDKSMMTIGDITSDDGEILKLKLKSFLQTLLTPKASTGLKQEVNRIIPRKILFEHKHPIERTKSKLRGPFGAIAHFIAGVASQFFRTWDKGTILKEINAYYFGDDKMNKMRRPRPKPRPRPDTAKPNYVEIPTSSGE